MMIKLLLNIKFFKSQTMMKSNNNEQEHAQAQAHEHAHSHEEDHVPPLSEELADELVINENHGQEKEPEH